MKERKNNKGITLVALIITIIVMLILVAVSISVVIRSNILNSAKNAAKQTEAASLNESEIENSMKIGNETVKEYIAKLDTTPPTVTIDVTTGSQNYHEPFNVDVTIADDNVDLTKCKMRINTTQGDLRLDEYKESNFVYGFNSKNEQFLNIQYPTYTGRLYIHVLAVDTTGNIIQVCTEGPYLEDCCFVAGTQVQYNLAGDTKAIEEFKTGDSVVSYNIETGEFYIAKVNKLIINPDATKMAKVYLENGEMLDMTDYHPLYTSEGFKSITNHNGLPTLEEGDLAKTIEGYSKITKIERYTVEPMATYNLDVQDFDEVIDNNEGDNFLVNGVVAHNCPV